MNANPWARASRIPHANADDFSTDGKGGVPDCGEAAGIKIGGGKLRAPFEPDSNPERKHLFHKRVKEVRVNGRLSVEVTLLVPQPGSRGRRASGY